MAVKWLLNDKFSESFNGSALDFSIKEGKSYAFTDGEFDLTKSNHFYPSYIANKVKECKDSKTVSRLDDDGNMVDSWGVGRNYYVKSHRKFFGIMEDKIKEIFPIEKIEDVEIKTSSAKGGRWGMREYIFPSIGIPVNTRESESIINLRIAGWTALDGSTANNFIIGAIDSFCSNGMIFTSSINKDDDIKQLYKRNSKCFDLDLFSNTIMNWGKIFERRMEEYQLMADTRLRKRDGYNFIDSLGYSEKKVKGFDRLYHNECEIRGENVFSLFSAFTNYSSHQNEDLFIVKKDINDTRALTMFKRQEEVTKIFESKKWKELVAA